MPDGVNATASATPPRRRRTAATAASVAGVFGFGLAAGVLLGSPVLAPTEVPVDSGASARAPRDAPSAATVMPDLLAMPEDAARQAIAQATSGSAQVTVTQQPAAGEAGRVLDQRPGYGEPVGVEVTLVVAAPATTPDVVGQDVSAATEALELLGAVVRERIEVRPELTAGTVLSTSPAAGEVLGEVVEVVVADPGNAFALTDFPVVDSSSCSITDDALLVGAVQPLSYSCRPDPEFPGVVELAVGRQASSLQMTLGADDRGGTQPAALVVIGDGRELQRLPVAFGGTQEVRLDVSGVLRLRLEIRTAAVDDAPSVVLGDAVLLGDEAGLGSLASP